MRILFVGKNPAQGLKDSDSSSFFSTAQLLGHQVVESIEGQPEIVICVDYKRGDMKIIEEAKRQNIPTVLIVTEPEVVIPQQFRKKVRSKFNKTLEIGRPDSTPCLKWPQTWRAVSKNQDRSQSIVMVNADKWSFIPGNLYWLRAAMASECNSLDVFGHGWDRKSTLRIAHRCFELLRTLAALRMISTKGISYILGRPRNFKGSVDDKVEEMSKYNVALVIENSQELLTEKIFDAWFAGCIPVYVGPSVEKFGIPSELVVESRARVESIKVSVDKALKLNRRKFIKSLERYLASNEGAAWQANNAIKGALEAAISPKISS